MNILFLPGLIPKILFPSKTRFLLLFAGLTALFPVFSQETTDGFDSIPISKPNASKMIFTFSDPSLQIIKLEMQYPGHRHQVHKQQITDLLTGTLAQIIFGGFAFESDMEVIWELSGELMSNDPYLNWTISLFCTGQMKKVSENVNGEDAFYSYEVTKTAYCDWENASIGIILERGDTIGRFGIIMDPKVNPLLMPRSAEVYSQTRSPVHTHSDKQWYKEMIRFPDLDYAIVGLFRNQEFTLINDGKSRKSWFYINNELVCIFRADIDFDRIKKEDRLAPYLWLKSSIPPSERHDWYRLAITSCYLNSRLRAKSFVY